MITERELYGPRPGDDEPCPACGTPRGDHPALIQASEVTGPKDCEWAIELLGIEDGLVLPILALIGVKRSDLPQDKLREMARFVWEWEGERAS